MGVGLKLGPNQVGGAHPARLERIGVPGVDAALRWRLQDGLAFCFIDGALPVLEELSDL